MARRRQANLDYRKQARRLRALGRLEHSIQHARTLPLDEEYVPRLDRLDTEAARLAAVIAAQGYTP